MARLPLVEQLDQAIEAIVNHPDDAPPMVDGGITEAVALAAELRHLPSADFKARLRAELEQRAASMKHTTSAAIPRTEPLSRAEVPILPTLFGDTRDQFPVHRMNFVASFVLHAAALALIIGSGFLLVKDHAIPRQQVSALLIPEPNPRALPAAPTQMAGGGGGGDRDKLQASKGNSPRFDRKQLAPPAVVIRNFEPKLKAEATVVGPPSLDLAKTDRMGAVLGAVVAAPSNGTGKDGGIGNGAGGGVGSGNGPGVGPGLGGGFGGGIYRVGGGVSAPRTIYAPDPEYSDEARAAKYQGTVVLWVVIGPDGRAREMRVQRSLGMGLDQKALDAVRKWRFEPAKKDGKPVAVQVNIEVDFRLY